MAFPPADSLDPVETRYPSETAGVADVDRRRVRPGAVWAFLGAYFGSYLMLVIPVASTLAIKVSDVVGQEDRATALGIIAGCGAFVAMLANPIIGALSDRTTSRWGMRRPWILSGALVGMASLTMLAFAPNIIVVGIAWALTQLAMNGVLAGLAAFLPDRVPEAQRGKVSAFTGIAQQVAPFFGIVVANIALGAGGGTPGMIVAPSILGLLLVILFVLAVRDRVLSPALRQRFSLKKMFAQFAFNPRKNPDFGWAWLGRFLISLAFAANSTYQVYFLNERLGIDLATVVTLQLGLVVIMTVMLSVSAAVTGIISDRLNRRKVFVFIASGLVALSSILTAFTVDLPLYFVVAGITGLATGAYFAVDLALVVDVLPNKNTAAAKDMGIFNIANTLPQSLAPALAPLLLAIGGGGNYTALYLGAAVCALVGALTVIPIKKAR